MLLNTIKKKSILLKSISLTQNFALIHKCICLDWVNLGLDQVAFCHFGIKYSLLVHLKNEFFYDHSFATNKFQDIIILFFTHFAPSFQQTFEVAVSFCVMRPRFSLDHGVNRSYFSKYFYQNQFLNSIFLRNKNFIYYPCQFHCLWHISSQLPWLSWLNPLHIPKKKAKKSWKKKLTRWR